MPKNHSVFIKWVGWHTFTNTFTYPLKKSAFPHFTSHFKVFSKAQHKFEVHIVALQPSWPCVAFMWAQGLFVCYEMCISISSVPVHITESMFSLVLWSCQVPLIFEGWRTAPNIAGHASFGGTVCPLRFHSSLSQSTLVLWARETNG